MWRNRDDTMIFVSKFYIFDTKTNRILIHDSITTQLVVN